MPFGIGHDRFVKQIEASEPLPRWLVVGIVAALVVCTVSVLALVFTGAPLGLLAVIPLMAGTTAMPLVFRAAARKQ